MLRLSDRTQRFGGSMIRAMSHSDNSDQAINLGQGYPDFDPPDALLSALARVAAAGPHQYAQTSGAADFKLALAAKISRCIGREVDPRTELLVTCGGTEAMMVALLTVVNPGDRVIVFEPYYENYVSQAVMAGAEIDYVPLLRPDFSIDSASLEKAFAKKPKAIIVCNPSNPTGKVFSRAELALIADLACKSECFMITDEVYEHIVFDGKRHTYAAVLPGVGDRVITCGSLSKTYAITGWRLGYIMADPRILQSANNVHDYLTVCAPAPIQAAALAGLGLPSEYYSELGSTYQGKRDLFVKGLRDIGLQVTKPQGAYYILLDTREFGIDDDFEFCRRLIDSVGVIAVPGSSFIRGESTKTVRLHFAKKESTLVEALNRLEKIKSLRR
jgi:aminotransferase